MQPSTVPPKVRSAPGRFIVLEGDEGAGKTTQLGLLATTLSAQGMRVQEIREPGGDPFSEELRRILKYASYEICPWAEALAFNAARANLLQTIVQPLLQRGTWVLSDRSYLSTLVYQGVAQQLSAEDMLSLKQMCQLGVRQVHPDLTVLLDVLPEVSAQRVLLRGERPDRMESRGTDYRQRINQGYRQLAAELNLFVVNANNSVDEVANDVLSVVLSALSTNIPSQ